MQCSHSMLWSGPGEAAREAQASDPKVRIGLGSF